MKREALNPKQRAFLESFAQTGNVKHASEAAHIHRSTHYAWLKEGGRYKTAFEAATEEAADTLEAEARRRALEGVEEPIIRDGCVVGTVRRYSDVLLIFLLKGARPQKYRDNAKVEVGGVGGGPLVLVRHTPSQREEEDLQDRGTSQDNRGELDRFDT